MASESISHKKTGGICETDKSVHNGFYCTEQGLKNLTDLIKILQDEREKAIDKAKAHSASIIYVIIKRAFNRQCAETFFSIENNVYPSYESAFEEQLKSSRWNKARICFSDSKKQQGSTDHSVGRKTNPGRDSDKVKRDNFIQINRSPVKGSKG